MDRSLITAFEMKLYGVQQQGKTLTEHSFNLQ